VVARTMRLACDTGRAAQSLAAICPSILVICAIRLRRMNRRIEKHRILGVPSLRLRGISRRFFCILLSLIGMCSSVAHAKENLPLVDDDRSKAMIILPANASKKLAESALVLQTIVGRSTGVELPVALESAAEANSGDGLTRIWIGRTTYTSSLDLRIEDLDEDGFIISFPGNQNIVILGPTDLGTEFGIYEFLERHVGVRFLMPGDVGTHVPRHPALRIPVHEVRQSPAFFSRHLTGLRGEAQHTWARRNRAHDRAKLDHNLYRLFPPTEYTRTHPQFFPVINGKRYLPPPGSRGRWQPCFTAPGIVEEAAKNICEYFAEHPEERSYSLGVNDGSGHCECDRCLAKDPGKKNYVGRNDVSDRYFEWVNAVVEKVLLKYPEKFFTCYAYSEIAQPPFNTVLHPRIIPFITYDRMKWIEESTEQEGHQITKAWSKKARALGWYDYTWGTPYCLPRVYFHKMAEYLRFGYSNGVRALLSEAHPNWGEGPKLYLALRLQWNPAADVDALLSDWYLNCVGAEAAGHLAEYYRLWEAFWTQRIPGSKWFTKKEQYLRFWDPSYLTLVKFEDIRRSRALLEETLRNTRTEEQRARAGLILRAFEYYEATALSYLGLVVGAREPGKTFEYYLEMNAKRTRLLDEFQSDPVLIHPARFDKPKYTMLRW